MGEAGLVIIGRIVSVFLMATAINGLLFAQLFSNLSALSAGFGERRTTALFVGGALLLVGVVVNVATARRDLVPTGRTGRVERIVLTTVVGVFVGWVSFGAVVYGLQDQLLFSPRAVSPARLERIARDYPRAEEVEIVAADGVVLRGWLVLPEKGQPAPEEGTPLVIVFAGQGGEASGYFDFTERLPEMAWAFINYRGYGASDGTPGDRTLFDDATTIYDDLSARPDIDEDNVFVLGGSLGTGVATYLAARRPVTAVVLFSPYDRIGGGVTQDMLPLVPTRWLFRHRFDAAAYAPDVQAPALAIVGGEDRVIRPERSRALLRHWGGGHRLVVVPEGDHYSIYEDDGVWGAVQRFVRGSLQ